MSGPPRGIVFSGMEDPTLEVSGSLPAAAAAALSATVPPPLAVERDADGRAVVALLVARMRGLGAALAPGAPPRLDYGEVLYRLGVRVDGEAGWLALACDLDQPLVARLASTLIRYPVRRAAELSIVERGSALEVLARTGGGALALRAEAAEPQDAVEPEAPRRTFVARGGRALEVPWAERPAASRRRVRVVVERDEAVRAVYGAAPSFAPHGVLHRGRTHLCGVARRLPRAPFG